MSKFFRFLSFRGGKPPGSNKSNLCSIKDNNIISTHSKLRDGCEDLKESIEHYNQRCLAVKELKEKELQEEKKEKENNNNVDSIPSSINAKFLSFKSKNKVKTINSKMRVTKNGQIIPKDSIECAVFFLDQTEEHFFVPKKCFAQKLYEQVFYHLDLIETDYFGLQFSDTHNVQHWLDSSKPIKKQCKIGPPYQFFFRVKFYTVEPNNLKEELTRYFYFLQLKNDLRTGRLQCQQESIAIELCALILQEELGDFDSTTHSIETVTEFRFLPEAQQTEQLEDLIFDKFKSTSYKAMTPAESELMFLNKAKWLEMYGVDMHCVYGRDGNEYKLGLTPSGILVFEEETIPNSVLFNNNKIGLFYWPKIEKVTFSKKKFTILVGEDDNRGFKQEHTFIFNLIDEKACKHLWKCAVEYHSFFRLKTSLITNSIGMTSGTNGSSLFNGFIRRGSRFRGPERTEYQTHNMTRLTTPRRSVQFERRPSQRFSRRAINATKRQKNLELKQQANDNSNLDLINMNDNEIKNPVVQDINKKTVPTPLPRMIKQNNQNTIVLSSSNSKLDHVETTVDKKPQTQLSVATSSIGHCCKMQMASNGGTEHDQKCNLFKAKQMQLKKESDVATTSPITKSAVSDDTCKTVNSTSKKSCISEPLNCGSNSVDEINQSSKTVSDLKVNLLNDDSEVMIKDNNASKLVEKATIFESLELNNEKTVPENIETSQSLVTDQLLINLSFTNNQEIENKNDKRNSVNLSIQNILEQPGTSIRFEDLKMTEI